MAAQKEHALVSTILVRTLMDRRYFHGIRTTAAAALPKHAKDELNWVGLHHLEKAFQEFFCFSNSPMTRSNDFSDRTTYYIQCAIPQAIAKVRDNVGKAPLRVKRFLFDKLKFNDNSNNEFSDSHYVATLMVALTESLIPKNEPSGYNFGFDDEEEDEARFHRACVDEIERYRRMDEWISSYQNVYSITALDCKRRLAQVKVVETAITDFLQYTRSGTFETLRLTAFSNLVELGLLKNEAILQWFLFVLGSDPSPYVRERMQRLFWKGLAMVAIGERTPKDVVPQQNGLIIEQESSTESRQADLARKQSVNGALAALKQDVGSNEELKKALWEAVTSPEISLFEMRDLLDICGLLYDPLTSMVVALKYPRYWKVKHLGNGRMKFSWTNKIRTKPIPKLQWPTTSASAVKREERSGGIAPTRTLLKPPKKPPAAAPPPPARSPPADGKPKLTIKLKMSGGSARSPPPQHS
ncbi:MAG: hypothetical protein M1830_005177 [Pleopsidium flavum]|nr:MAG: hypothetical protein M1830_005177 [Pleopsidium flavum]